MLDDGWLVELGTQDELLARDGLYARLHRTQFSEPMPVEEAEPVEAWSQVEAVVYVSTASRSVPEEFGERRQLVVGVEAARVGQDPQAARAETLGLRTDHGLRVDRRRSRYAETPRMAMTGRSIALRGLEEAAAAVADLVGSELGGGRGRAVDEVGDAEAGLEHGVAVPGRQESIGEARGVERRPEAVARPGEMAPGGARVAARVDAAEEDAQVRGDEVGDGQAVGGREFGGRRAPGLRTGEGTSIVKETRRVLPIRR